MARDFYHDRDVTYRPIPWVVSPPTREERAEFARAEFAKAVRAEEERQRRRKYNLEADRGDR
jgi:hypothetical protein